MGSEHSNSLLSRCGKSIASAARSSCLSRRSCTEHTNHVSYDGHTRSSASKPSGHSGRFGKHDKQGSGNNSSEGRRSNDSDANWSPEDHQRYGGIRASQEEKVANYFLGIKYGLEDVGKSGYRVKKAPERQLLSKGLLGRLLHRSDRKAEGPSQ